MRTSRKVQKIKPIYDNIKEISDRVKEIYNEVKKTPGFFENPENFENLNTRVSAELAHLPGNLLELIAKNVPFEVRPSDDTEEKILQRVEEELDKESFFAHSLGWDGLGHRIYQELPKKSTVENILKKNAMLEKANEEKIRYSGLIRPEIVEENDEEKLTVSITSGGNWNKLTRLPVKLLKDIEKKNDLAITSLTIEGHGFKKPRELLNFPYLHNLTLQDTHIEELPDMSGFEYLTNVNLDKNNFDGFPLQLLDLTKAK